MEKCLYVVTTQKCNLKCAHCYIGEIKEVFNEELFLSKLNSFDGRLIMFGGEFTSNMERFRKILKSNDDNGISKFSSASTNLVILNDELLEFYKRIGGIGTSWNYDRFGSNSVYQQWLRNLKTLDENNIYSTILITLTKDLIQLDPKEFLKIANDFDHEDRDIKFEQYVGSDVNQDHYNRVDNWLCEIYKNWNLKSRLLIAEDLDQWMYDCNETYTLFPDGTMINRCPQNLPSNPPKVCLTCENATHCRPCRLTPYCTFPKKLAKLVEEDNKKNLDK